MAPYLAVGSTAATMLMGLLLCAAVPFRRRVPSLALAIGLTGAAGHLILLTQPTLSLIVVPILVYSIARWGERRLGRTTFGFALLGSLLGPVRWAMLRRSRRRSDQRRLSLGAAESQHH
ncbi:MAG TPA: hypothetical protein VLJ88_00070 [Propionibacteriaceae bacterium]|nr:hypothetical protein [Propionibacteriaceae bacterium]